MTASNLKFIRDARGVWCADGYEIAGPGSDLAKHLGGISYWYLNGPGGLAEGFGTKRSAVEHAEAHFQTRLRSNPKC